MAEPRLNCPDVVALVGERVRHFGEFLGRVCDLPNVQAELTLQCCGEAIPVAFN
jgi:hypothetical protein